MIDIVIVPQRDADSVLFQPRGEACIGRDSYPSYGKNQTGSLACHSLPPDQTVNDDARQDVCAQALLEGSLAIP